MRRGAGLRPARLPAALVVALLISLSVAGLAFGLRAAKPSKPSTAIGASTKRWNPTPQDRWVYEIGRDTPRLELCVKPWSGDRCVRPTVWVLDLYAIDGVTLNTMKVAAVHRKGGRAVCYVSAGSVEDWRPDAPAFPVAVVGRALDGWPGERWIDIRDTGILRPILEARADRCKQAGFDAIDWDNVDGYSQDTGFPLRADDQLAYNRLLATISHERGMSVGLKNDLLQIPELLGAFDFAVNEQCAQYKECDLLLPFSKSGKAVVQIEYAATPGSFCGEANKRRWSAMAADPALNGIRWQPCR